MDLAYRVRDKKGRGEDGEEMAAGLLVSGEAREPPRHGGREGTSCFGPAGSDVFFYFNLSRF